MFICQLSSWRMKNMCTCAFLSKISHKSVDIFEWNFRKWWWILHLQLFNLWRQCQSKRLAQLIDQYNWQIMCSNLVLVAESSSRHTLSISQGLFQIFVSQQTARWFYFICDVFVRRLTMKKAGDDEGASGSQSPSTQQLGSEAAGGKVQSKLSAATSSSGPGWTKVSCPCCYSDRVEPLVLVKLGKKVGPETKRWLIKLIGAPHKDGGEDSGFQLRRCPSLHRRTQQIKCLSVWLIDRDVSRNIH